MWITGGMDSNWNNLHSTKVVTINGSTSGIDLPFTVSSHCMVQYQPNAVILIGGDQNGNADSDKTWLIDPTNGFDIIQGPNLNQGRAYHSCGILKDDSGNVLVIVAGGGNMKSVEVLNTTSLKEWIEGRYIF